MFSPTTNPVRTTAWRRAVLDAVDLAVAFATLDGYTVPGSTRAERSTSAQAGVDRSARSGDVAFTDVPAAEGPLSRLDRRLPERTGFLPRPHVAVDPSHGPHRLPPRSASVSRRGRRPGTVPAAHHCTSPLDALSRAEHP